MMVAIMMLLMMTTMMLLMMVIVDMINGDQPSCNEGTNNGEDHKPECKVQESLLWMVNEDYRIFM